MNQAKYSIRKIVNRRGGKQWALILPSGQAVPFHSHDGCWLMLSVGRVEDLSLFNLLDQHEYCRAVVHA